jgi:protoheme IX farnesyltransferase
MLTKPGIIMGNVITTAAGFALASKGKIDLWLFLAALSGLGLVIAASGIFNNYLDREADAKMSRTRNRPLVTGLISGKSALVFGSVLGLIGIAILYAFTNLLAAAIAIVGFLLYVVLYGICKYRTIHGTLIGSLSGAMPPVIGYAAASGRLDLGALLIFLILIFWQMPHFFAIAIFRFNDYLSASIPVFPVIKGPAATKFQMLFYTLAFLAAALLPTVFGYTGLAYFATALVLGIAWLCLCIQGFRRSDDRVWARQMFVFSLVAILALSAMIPIDIIRGGAAPIIGHALADTPRK